jgi:hypothetical protein
MQLPSMTTRSLIERRIARAELALEGLTNKEKEERVLGIIRAALFEHRPGIGSAFFALVDERVDEALADASGIPFTDPRFAFLSDSVDSLDIRERAELFRLLLDLAEEKSATEEPCCLYLALALLEHKFTFPAKSLPASLTLILRDAVSNRIENVGEYQTLSVLKSAVAALARVAEDSL